MIRVFERSTIIQNLIEEFEVLGSLEYKKEVSDRTFFYAFQRRSFSVDNTTTTAIVFTQTGTFIDIYFYTEGDTVELQSEIVRLLTENGINSEIIKEQ